MSPPITDVIINYPAHDFIKQAAYTQRFLKDGLALSLLTRTTVVLRRA
ncbi:MAG: hypothetical protein ACREVY_05080 [Gammaproteobacteria bacterium]